MLNNSKSPAEQAVQNKQEIESKFLNGDVITTTMNDSGEEVIKQVKIEDFYQEIQRDLFLKWDKLEQKKAELRDGLQELENATFAPESFKSPIKERYERVIESIEEYQGELETAQDVLEFEEEQHATGKR